MYCIHCGQRIPDDSAFCIICGKPQPPQCLQSPPAQQSLPVAQPETVAQAETAARAEPVARAQNAPVQSPQGPLTAQAWVAAQTLTAALPSDGSAHNAQSPPVQQNLPLAQAEAAAQSLTAVLPPDGPAQIENAENAAVAQPQTKPKGLWWKILSMLASVAIIIGGLSGEFVLRGTDSSEMLVVFGCLWLAYDIYALATHNKKSNAGAASGSAGTALGSAASGVVGAASASAAIASGSAAAGNAGAISDNAAARPNRLSVPKESKLPVAAAALMGVNVLISLSLNFAGRLVSVWGILSLLIGALFAVFALVLLKSRPRALIIPMALDIALSLRFIGYALDASFYIVLLARIALLVVFIMTVNGRFASNKPFLSAVISVFAVALIINLVSAARLQVAISFTTVPSMSCYYGAYCAVALAFKER
jgi:hypothetical protein